jgi:hypothetical protein
MVKPPKKWQYILIECEIDGVIVDSIVATQFTFDKNYSILLREAQTQTLPGGIFILRFYYQMPVAAHSTIYRDRDKNGRFIKNDAPESIITNTI